jgi:hypothetical protein
LNNHYTHLAKRWAYRYRDEYGWNPLPSLATEKRPSICYSELWDRPVWDWVLASWDCPNLQLMTGARWGLAVVDLDGPLAPDAWASMTLHRENPWTWTVLTGSGGWHLYYTVPTKVTSLPSRVLWDSREKHSKIELLGDKRLVVAPPSRHVRTLKDYVYKVGLRDMPSPAFLPRWLVDMPGLSPPPVEPRTMPVAEAVVDLPDGHYDRRRVLEAIPDKLSLVRSWGLRVLDRRNGSGWCRCHAVDREDECPSASFNPETGWYSEPGMNRKLSLFDIGVFMGAYRTWVDAVNHLGHQFGATH